MPKLELGAVGAVISPDNGGAFVHTAVRLEELGYSTIWITGGPLDNLSQITDVVGATKHVRVATGIISVDRFGVDEVAELYTELEGAHPGRFVVGLGGAHGPKPVATLTTYLEQLAAVPTTARVMAALGPRMLDLARDHAAGALAVLVTPGYTAEARSSPSSPPALTTRPSINGPDWPSCSMACRIEAKASVGCDLAKNRRGRSRQVPRNARSRRRYAIATAFLRCVGTLTLSRSPFRREGTVLSWNGYRLRPRSCESGKTGHDFGVRSYRRQHE
jgi:hypothetical protein